jgi:hypothetical protein
MNTRMLALQPGAKFIAFVHRPAVQQQQDVRIGVEVVHADHPLRMRMEDVGDPALHRLLRAPVVGAVGDVDPCSSGCRCGRRERASSLALEDQLQRQKIAAQRRRNARCDLSLVLRSHDGNIAAPHHLIRPRRCRHEVHTCLIHVDDKRWMYLHRKQHGHCICEPCAHCVRSAARRPFETDLVQLHSCSHSLRHTNALLSPVIWQLGSGRGARAPSKLQPWIVAHPLGNELLRKR